MSSVSPSSELLPDSSGSFSTGSVGADPAPTDAAERQGSLAAYLHQAVQMLDLQPEAELAKYRAYKESSVASTREKNYVVAAPEEEDEEYEKIPPSEPFAVMEHTRAYPPDSAVEPAGKLVFRDSEPPVAGLDLSMLPPGEISSARNEYLPASQELWRSLGKPAAPAEIPIPKWKLPVAIGSVLTALTAVSGMTYINLHPTLLRQVPVVAQLTAPPVLPAIPPGQNLAGPDLAMGEFTDLGLGNINSIVLPGNNTQLAQAPAAATVIAPVAPVNTVPTTAVVPTTPQVVVPNTTASKSTNLSDTLVRNLLPPNIQQMAGNDGLQPSVVAPATQSPAQTPITPPVPYVPSTPIGQNKSKKISAATDAKTEPYQVMAKYINPIGFEQIRKVTPNATRVGDRIVVGNFSEKNLAKNLVRKLKQQGVEAWLNKNS
jgi:hypothetical protein